MEIKKKVEMTSAKMLSWPSVTMHAISMIWSISISKPVILKKKYRVQRKYSCELIHVEMLNCLQYCVDSKEYWKMKHGKMSENLDFLFFLNHHHNHFKTKVILKFRVFCSIYMIFDWYFEEIYSYHFHLMIPLHGACSTRLLGMESAVDNWEFYTNGWEKLKVFPNVTNGVYWKLLNYFLNVFFPV